MSREKLIPGLQSLSLPAGEVAAGPRNAPRSNGPEADHGRLCDHAIPIPGEDHGYEERRYNAWLPERNLGRSNSGDYLVRMAVRASVRLDRTAIVHDARVAKLARDAVQVRAEERGKAVDELAILMGSDCSAAARRLKTTSEGCDWLIREWGLLLQTLVEPTRWDGQDQTRANRLLGLGASLRDQAPGALAVETHALIEHRRIAQRIEANRWPETVDWKLKYGGPWAREEDESKLVGLTEAANAGRTAILGRIEAEMAGLEAIKASLADTEAADRDEATYRDRFDASPVGTLLHRHEGDAERTIVTLFKELRAVEKGESLARQTLSREVVQGGRTGSAGPLGRDRNDSHEVKAKPPRMSQGEAGGRSHSSPDVSVRVER